MGPGPSIRRNPPRARAASGSIRPEGWQNWGKPQREKTARYAEFGSSADTSGRVAWAKQFTREQAEAITMDKVLDGWKPLSGESK